MPVITQCPKCGKKLKAPDQKVGQQAKCPQCKNPFTIQALSAVSAGVGTGGSSSPSQTVVPQAAPRPVPVQPAAQPQVPQQAVQPQTVQPQLQPQHPQVVAQPQAVQPDKWFVQTSEGAEYGPVTKAELDQWIIEERIDADCQLLQEGWTQWQWAEDVYPQLSSGGQVAGAGGEQQAANPFAAIGESAAGTAAANPFAAVGGESNPYASPQATSSVATGGGADDGAVSQKVIRHMDGTRPWVMFFCVLAFIAAGFAALGMVMAIFVLIAVPLAGVMMFVLYGAMGGIYGFIGFLLLKYNKAMSVLVRSRGMPQLEKTTEAQVNFWKTVGILTIVMIGLMVVSWILMFLGAMAGAAGGPF